MNKEQRNYCCVEWIHEGEHKNDKRKKHFRKVYLCYNEFNF